MFPFSFLNIAQNNHFFVHFHFVVWSISRCCFSFLCHVFHAIFVDLNPRVATNLWGQDRAVGGGMINVDPSVWLASRGSGGKMVGAMRLQDRVCRGREGDSRHPVAVLERRDNGWCCASVAETMMINN